jgi:Pectate lyase superfamily protein
MTLAQLSPTPVFKAFANDGTPLAYGKLYSYIAGTTTPQATYPSQSESTPNPNPIILNARGECALWLDPTLAYKLNLTDLFGNQIAGYPVDNIQRYAQLPIDSVNIRYDITAAETAAGVTPTNYNIVPLNILRYGADPSGVANSDSAIQAAIDVAAINGGTVYIPSGVYRLAIGLTISDEAQGGIKIIGDGWQTVTGSYATSAGSRLYYYGTGNLFSINGSSSSNVVDNIWLQSFSIENKSGVVGSTIGIQISNSRWHKYWDLYIVGFNTGLDATSDYFNSYIGLLIYNSGSYGFNGHQSGEDNYFANCFIRYSATGYGVIQNQAQNCTYDNVDFSDNAVGLSLFTGSNASVSSAVCNGCIFENCTTNAVQLNDSGTGGDLLQNYPRLVLSGGRMFWSSGGTAPSAVAATLWNSLRINSVYCNYTNFVDTSGGPGNVALIHLEGNEFFGSGSLVVGSLQSVRASDNNWSAQHTISSFLNSWVADTETPYYWRDKNNRVNLAGSIKSGVLNNTAFILPAGFRPAQTVVKCVSSNGAFGYCTINTSGFVVPVGGSTITFSLDDISFDIGN